MPCPSRTPRLLVLTAVVLGQYVGRFSQHVRRHRQDEESTNLSAKIALLRYILTKPRWVTLYRLKCACVLMRETLRGYEVGMLEGSSLAQNSSGIIGRRYSILEVRLRIEGVTFSRQWGSPTRGPSRRQPAGCRPPQSRTQRVREALDFKLQGHSRH